MLGKSASDFCGRERVRREWGCRDAKPMRISERREWVGVSTVEMLMCSKVEGEGRGWHTGVEERERVRRKEGVDGGMTT